jgi:hypothetical protein
VATISWVVGWCSSFIVEVKVVCFEPVGYCVRGSGGAGALWHGTLPPGVVSVQVSHQDAVVGGVYGV